MTPFGTVPRHLRDPVGGFTLIELMITLLIIAILAAIALPSYQEYLIRARRSTAQQLMIGIASRQEQYMLDQRAYTATIGTGGLRFTEDGWTCAAACTNAYYSVAVALTAGPPAGFTITATPVAGTRQAADGALTLDSLGGKAPLDKWKR